jgi:hypothetical protein
MASSSNLSTARVAVSRTVVISSLLLRVGISGVALAVWAAVGVASAEVSVPTAIAALVAGVAIAVVSLRRAWTMLDKDGDSDVDAQPTVARNRPRVATAIARATR